MEICEVCGGRNIRSALDLGSHPLCDDLVPLNSDRVCKEYPIDIWVCSDCITAHQRCQVPKTELFPADYHYRSRFTADVLNGMKNLVEACESRIGSLAGKKILDIGCNDGSLLNFFRDKKAVTAGIEPTDAADYAEKNSHFIYKEYFDDEAAEKVLRNFGAPDVITFTNVFAHIEDLPAMLGALKKLLQPSTLLVIENHYFGSVLERFQFDTFYHEHPRTYSLHSFLVIAKTLGLQVLAAEFPARYGGNIRVFMGEGDALMQADIADILKKEIDYPERLSAMLPHIEAWKKSTRQKIDMLVNQHGALTAKAFPGRAAVLIKLLGLDKESIRGVYEKPGSMKIGHYLPGTRIPIHSDEDLFAQAKPAVILNLAWHIGAEIRKYLHQNGCDMPVIDIVDATQFSA